MEKKFELYEISPYTFLKIKKFVREASGRFRYIIAYILHCVKRQMDIVTHYK